MHLRRVAQEYRTRPARVQVDQVWLEGPLQFGHLRAYLHDASGDATGQCLGQRQTVNAHAALDRVGRKVSRRSGPVQAGDHHELVSSLAETSKQC
jgi:hypothetical protein